MIDHVTANVGDFGHAKGFYEKALAPLGYSLQMEFEGAAGFGSGEGVPDFWIGSSDERSVSGRQVAIKRKCFPESARASASSWTARQH